MLPRLLPNLCRLCLVKDKVSVPIFEGEGVERRLHMKITTCLPVQVSKDDQLPKRICGDCLNKVEHTYLFRIVTASAEKHLHRMLLEAKRQKLIVNIVGSHQTEKELNLVENKRNQECKSSSNLVIIKEECDAVVTGKPPPVSASFGGNTACIVTPIRPQQAALALVFCARPLSIVPKENRVAAIAQTKPLFTASSPPPLRPLSRASHPPQLKSIGSPENAMVLHRNEGEQCGEERNNLSAEEPGSTPEEKPKTTGITSQKCEFCGKHLPNAKLIIHRRTHTGEKPFVCVICTEAFISKRALKKHSVIHSDERPYACDMCPRRFKRSFEVKKHRETHLGEKSHVCDICGYSCVQKTNLLTHRKRHFNEYKVRCHICNKGFYANGELRLHLNGHTGDRPHQCHVCGLTFRVRKALTDHSKTHIPGYVPLRKKFNCEICGKGYSSKQVLVRHIKCHTGESRRPCDICGKLCSADYMKVHVRTHTGEKPEKCDVCGKNFVCKSILNTHMRIHTGERPYKCNLCGKAFTQHSSLAVHKRSTACSMTAADQFVCHCGEAFNTNELLTNHLTTQHC